MLAPALLLSASLLTSCGSQTSTDAVALSGEQGTCTYPASGQAAKPVRLPPVNPDEDPLPERMTLKTSAGDVAIVFDTAEAPCTVNSFASLARQGYFNNTTCHRVTTQGIFVLQCGDPTATGQGGPGYSVPDELIANDPRLVPCSPAAGTCTYSNGYIAMANNGSADSGGSQFFLVYRDSPLPPTYTVFAHTDASGLKVLQQIGSNGTADGAVDGDPKSPVMVTSVR